MLIWENIFCFYCTPTAKVTPENLPGRVAKGTNIPLKTSNDHTLVTTGGNNSRKTILNAHGERLHRTDNMERLAAPRPLERLFMVLK